MGILIRLLINALGVAITAYLMKPKVEIDSFVTSIVVALVLAISNIIIKPILHLLALPLTIITFGLFSFVINGIIILLVDFLVPGFKVDGFLWAIVFSFLLSIINSVLNKLVK